MFTRAEKFLLFALAFIQFSHIVDFMILMPLGPSLMRTFEITPTQFGLLVSAYTFSGGTTGLISALFLDRFDRKKSLLFFYLGFSLGTLACAFAPTYELLMLGRIFTGAFGGVLGSQILSIIGDSIETHKRGTATGLVMSAFSFASVVGVPFALYLANHFDWHAPFLFLGGLSLLLMGLIYKAVPAMSSHLKHERENPVTVLKEYLSQKTYLIPLIFMILLIFGQFSVIPFLSPSFVANTGLLESQLPLIYLVGGICSIVSGPLIGRISDRVGKARVFVTAALFSILPLLILTHLGPTPAPVLLFVVGLFFIAMGGRMIPAMALITGTVPPHRRGSYMSVVSSTQQFSSAAASFVAGLMITKSQAGQILGYGHVGIMAAVFTLFAIMMIRQIRSQY
jgi:DHA1 family inner membrane transport protein